MFLVIFSIPPFFSYCQMVMVSLTGMVKKALEAFESICTAGLAADDSSSLSAKATGASSVTNRPAFGLPTGSAGGDEVTTTQTTNAEETDAPTFSSSRSSAAGVGMAQQQPLGGVAKWVVNGLVAVAGFLVV